MAQAEAGRCDAEACWPDYVADSSGYWTFNNCDQLNVATDGLPIIPTSAPIKTNIKGLNISPFVKLRFEDNFSCASSANPGGTPPNCWDYTEITTGNISQPFAQCDDGDLGCQCRAAIKSFQYSWGTVQSGQTCKITIVDEKGSDIADWFARIFKNPAVDPVIDNQGVYKMKVTFGWIIAGEDANCPADLVESGTTVGECIEQGIYPYSFISTIPINNSTTPTRFICSPPLWFLPNNLNTTYQGNKIIFEITGIDLMQRATEQPLDKTYGEAPTNTTTTTPGPGAQIHFVEAVQQLCADSLPPMRVGIDPTSDEFSFKRLGTGGVVENMKFHVFNDTAASTTPSGIPIPANSEFPTYSQLQTLGPIGVWATNQLTPLQVLRQWMDSHNVLAENTFNDTDAGIGITINFDPINRKLTFWADAHPSCRRLVDIRDRLKAVYLVNGGACSPVLNFTPTAKYNFLLNSQAGGNANPATNRVSSASDATRILDCGSTARGPRMEATQSTSSANTHGEKSGERTQVSTAANRIANFMHTTIEAELRVQGDPSDFLCSPLFGYGRCIGLVVVNPFYLNREDGDDCPTWDQLTNQSCNRTFTSASWFIRGVDHQIKEGSFVTTYKLSLFAPNSEVVSERTISGSTTPTPLGGDTLTLTTTSDNVLTACGQGVYPCVSDGFSEWMGGALDENPYNLGGGDSNRIFPVAGTYIFCAGICTTNPGIA